MELNDILKEEETPAEAPAETVEATAPEEPEVEKPTSRRKTHQEKEQRARDEGGKFVKEEKPEEPKEEPAYEVKAEAPKQEMSEKERAFLATVQEERRKRQELERRLAEIEKAKPKEEVKTFWDDPEGHLNSFKEQIAKERTTTVLQTSEAIARSKYQDFDEKIGVFAEILQSTPGLHAQWLQAPDPAEFAYRLGKHTKELRDVGSIDALRERVRKEERLRIEAEFKKKQEEFEKQRAELTPSLSDVRGAARRTQPVFTGPTPLDDILASK